MGRKKQNPGARGGATGAVDSLRRPTQSRSTLPRQAHFASYVLSCGGQGQPPLTIYVKGRVQWALERLLAAGPEGCSSFGQPAPRWASYVFSLRSLGVPIETIHEPHGGAYPGTHARYVLRAKLIQGGEGQATDGQAL